MLKVNDPTSITVPGSRWPITLKKSDTAKPQTSSSSPTLFKRPAPISMSTSTSRRKPRVTYQSPDAGAPLSVPSSMSSRTSATASPTSSSSVSTSCHFFTPAKPLFKLQPDLPSYHPLSPGQLVLAAAARADAAARRKAAAKAGSVQDDTSIDGDASNNHPANGSANGVDDDTDARRSSSRNRRPVAKLREGAEAEGDDGASNAGTDNLNGANGKSPTGNKRRRAAGGGGSRKKKKEPSATPAEPYPPRRERQRRGAAQAAAAALASSAEAAEALSAALDDEAMEVDETASVAASAIPDAEAEAVQDDETKSAGGASEPSGDLNDQVTPSTGPVRPKRASRPKRGRVSSSASGVKDETPTPSQSTSTRTTRGSAKRRGSSASGSEASTSTSTGSAAPIAETLAARRNNRAKDTNKEKDKSNKSTTDVVGESTMLPSKGADEGSPEEQKMDTREDTEEGEVQEEAIIPIDPSLMASPGPTITTLHPAADAVAPAPETATVAA